jgi:transposase
MAEGEILEHQVAPATKRHQHRAQQEKRPSGHPPEYQRVPVTWRSPYSDRLLPPYNRDEKSQILALDRTQPSLPMKRGRAGTMTHDYKRHGTTTLFAAMDVLTGKVIGECHPRHRNGELLKFLRRIDSEVPKALQVHLILDNYGSHKHAKVVKWLEAHPRFHMHFVPTSSSWLNLVERWFKMLTDKAVRRGVFRSVSQLIAAIEALLSAHNEDPKPFVWTAKAEEIIAKVRTGRAASMQSPANYQTLR